MFGPFGMSETPPVHRESNFWTRIANPQQLLALKTRPVWAKGRGLPSDPTGALGHLGLGSLDGGSWRHRQGIRAPHPLRGSVWLGW
jgi:hypothetical protein